MTAPAPRNHPAENAHPAPAAAPVAVPDIEAMPIRERDDLVSAVLRFMTDRGYRVMMPPRNLPIMDARPEPVVAPLPSEPLRRLAERGVGTDLNPTASPSVDVGWWYEYLRALDSRWREEVTRIADRLVPEDNEDTVRVPGFLIRVAAPTVLASDDPIVRRAARKLLDIVDGTR